MKAKITLENIKGFLQGNTRKIFDEWLGLFEPHIKEQATWRLLQVQKKSPKCFEADECQVCHCVLSGKVFEDRPCSKEDNPCYPKILSKENWEEYKQTGEYLISIV